VRGRHTFTHQFLFPAGKTKGTRQERRLEETHLMLLQQLQPGPELTVVERPNDLTKVRLEVEELAKVGVLEDTSAKLCAIEGGEGGEDGVEGDVGRGDELCGEERVSPRRRERRGESGKEGTGGSEGNWRH
jgi:hypothetical protein